jgi:hypothetical protein
MTSPTTDRRQGLVGNTPIKVPVDCATTGPITLSGEQTIDGVLTSGSRVLVKNQVDGTQNGIYDTSTGAWTRSLDADGTYDLTTGTMVSILGGASQGNSFFQVATAKPVSIGSSILSFIQSLFSNSSVLSFLQAGVGAVVRSVLAKLRERVSLEDFGGIGDSNGTTGTDNAAAFAAAIAALPASGGRIEVGTGRFLVASPIVLPSPGHYEIVGKGSSEASNNPSATEIIKAATMTSAAIVVNGPHSRLHGFNLRGVAGNTGDGIQISANGVHAERVSVFGAGQDGWRIGTDAGVNANSFCLQNCRGSSNGRFGYFLSDKVFPTLPDANAGLLVNCVGQSNTNDGIRFGNSGFNEIVGGTWESNGGCGARFLQGSKFNSIAAGDFEANLGTAQISVEAGAVWTKVFNQSGYYESAIADAGTATQILMPSSSNAGWVHTGVFRIYMGHDGGGNDIIAGSAAGGAGSYGRLLYGPDATDDAHAHVLWGSAGLRLGQQLAGVKMGLFGVNPVLRPTTAGAAAAFVANAGTAVNDASTFDGFTIPQVVRALRTVGVLT